MDMEEAFKLAQEETRFIKVRKNLLYTFGATRLPYICITQNPDDAGLVLVRNGEVLADKPQIALPGELFSFEGFEDLKDMFQDEPMVALARRISMPPSKYVNKAEAPDMLSGSLSDVIQKVMNQLENDNDVRTGVIAAPEQVWPISVLLYVGGQVTRSAQSNVQEHIERLRFNQ